MAGKRGATRLLFALLLKHYTRHGRFLRGRSEFPAEVVAFVARQMKVPAADLGFYEWTGRTLEYHRNQIREHLGFRVCGVADAEKLTAWLARTSRMPNGVPSGSGRSCSSRAVNPERFG